MIKQYKKKPIVIEAIQLTKDNFHEVDEFTENIFLYMNAKDDVTLLTLEGEMNVEYGNYIIKGVKGEFHAVDKEIFEETYEEVRTI